MIRRAVAIVGAGAFGALLATSVASARPLPRPRVVAVPTSCSASPRSPCADLRSATIRVRVFLPRTVTILSVAARPSGETRWRPTTGRYSLVLDGQRVDGPTVRLTRAGNHTIQISFAPIAVPEGEVRIAVEVNGRPYVRETTHVVE